MADVNRATGLSSTLDTSMGSTAPQIYDYPAAEAIESGQAVALNANGDGLVKADGSDDATVLIGFAGRTVKAGMRLTAFGPGARFGGFTSLTPGQLLYLSATPGELADAAEAEGVATPVARAITATDIQIISYGV